MWQPQRVMTGSVTVCKAVGGGYCELSGEFVVGMGWVVVYAEGG